MGNVLSAASELVIDTGPEPVCERQEQDSVSSWLLLSVCALFRLLWTLSIAHCSHIALLVVQAAEQSDLDPALGARLDAGAISSSQPAGLAIASDGPCDESQDTV